MNKSIFLARVIGLFLLIMSLAFFINREIYIPTFAAAFNVIILQFIFGTILLIAGTLLIVSHNIWQPSWLVVITIISWLIFIKGILYLVFPQLVQAIAHQYFITDAWIYAGGLVNLVLGLFLCYKGFINTKIRGRKG